MKLKSSNNNKNTWTNWWDIKLKKIHQANGLDGVKFFWFLQEKAAFEWENKIQPNNQPQKHFDILFL